MRLETGFTLIELVVTVVVAAVLTAIAVPSFTRIVVSNRLSATANSLAAALSQARLEAVRRNTTTQFCSNLAANNGDDTLGTACSTDAGAVYVLEPAGTATQVQGPPLLPTNVSLGNGSGGTTAVKALRYVGSGQARVVGGSGPYSGLVAEIYTTRISTNNHRCIYLTTGSIVSTCTTSAACNATTEPSPCQQ